MIGAMKCGTTTLYHDLQGHPLIQLCEKETNWLAEAELSTNELICRYQRAFRRAAAGECCGEVSTHYSMLPDFPGVAQRAAQFLPPSTKIIYLVREPVSRAISHHFHMYAWRGEGKMGPDVNECVRRHASIVNYSRYAMQLQPWREAFGDAAVHVVVFEDYIASRMATIARICRFLGVPARRAVVKHDTVYNRGDGKPVLNPAWARVRNATWYQQLVRPFIPHRLRDRFRAQVLPKAPPRPAPPSRATVDYLLEQLRDDAEQMRRFLGRSDPIWDFCRVRQKYLAVADDLAA